MINTFIEKYYDFFDKHIKNTTLIILLIATFITLVWFLMQDWNQNYYRDMSNQKTKNYIYKDIIEIWGNKYNVLYERIEK